MRIPLLVRLNDSQIELVEFVVAEFSDGLDHAWRVREQVRAGSVAIDQKAPLPDLNIEPIHRNIQLNGELLSTEHVRRMPLSRSLLGNRLESGA